MLLQCADAAPGWVRCHNSSQKMAERAALSARRILAYGVRDRLLEAILQARIPTPASNLKPM